MDVLNQIYDKIEQNMKEISDTVGSANISKNYDSDDLFLQTMSEFYTKSEAGLTKFRRIVTNTGVATQRLCKKFAFGDPDNSQPFEHLISTLYQFLIDFKVM